MDYQNNYDHNIRKSMYHSRKSSYLKPAIKILLSVSIFSILFSQSSSLIPVLVDSFDHYISDFSIKIFTYKTERNYIFLLCNGILVLIIQTSGLISKITPVKASTTSKAKDTTNDHTDHYEAEKNDESGGEFQEKKIKSIGKVAFLDQEKGIRVTDGNHDGAAEVDQTADHKKMEQNLENEEEVLIDVWEEDEEAIEDDDEMINADELHKKCEDFIKKVKQEIQVEFSGRLITTE